MAEQQISSSQQEPKNSDSSQQLKGNRQKQFVDVWKYPHMTYKKAFAGAAIISICFVGLGFYSFSEYIRSNLSGPTQINFLTSTEAEKVVEEVKEQEKQEEQEVKKSWNPTNQGNTGNGGGTGGQQGSSSTPTKSPVSPINTPAAAGEASTLQKSSIGKESGDGLAGVTGPGIGTSTNNSDGEGPGDNSDGHAGTDDTDTGGGGVFDTSGYEANLQSAAVGSYPRQAIQLGVYGTVELEITFDADGNVISVVVLSSPDDVLSDHARDLAYGVGGAENSTGQQRTATVSITYPEL